MADKERPHKHIPTFSNQEQSDLYASRAGQTGNRPDPKQDQMEEDLLRTKIGFHNSFDEVYREGFNKSREAMRYRAMMMGTQHPAFEDTTGPEAPAENEGVSQDTKTQPSQNKPLFETIDRGHAYHDPEVLMGHVGPPQTLQDKVGLLLNPNASLALGGPEKLRAIKRAGELFPDYGDEWGKLPPNVREAADNRILSYETGFVERQSAREQRAYDSVRRVVNNKKNDAAFRRADEKKLQPQNKMGGKGSV